MEINREVMRIVEGGREGILRLVTGRVGLFETMAKYSARTLGIWDGSEF